MIRGIAYQKVDITDAEYEYYKKMVNQYSDDHQNGEDLFTELFDVDQNGIIISIHPNKSIPWAVLFYIQNVMINQHLRSNDQRIMALEKAIGAKK